MLENMGDYSPTVVHSLMFCPNVEALCDEEQRKYWLPRCLSMEVRIQPTSVPTNLRFNAMGTLPPILPPHRRSWRVCPALTSAFTRDKYASVPLNTGLRRSASLGTSKRLRPEAAGICHEVALWSSSWRLITSQLPRLNQSKRRCRGHVEAGSRRASSRHALIPDGGLHVAATLWRLCLCQVTGCYAQTELGHGSNIRALQTSATFIRETDEFEIHTPCLTATKW